MRFCRYFYVAGEEAGSNTAEDTVKDDDDFPSDHTHRNYDEAVDELTCGTHFLASAAHVPGCKRRHPARLGVARIPYIEPIGESRENFYEAKLVLSLPWFCPELPAETENGEVVWTFRCRLPELRQHVEIDDLKIGKHPPSLRCSATDSRSFFANKSWTSCAGVALGSFRVRPAKPAGTLRAFTYARSRASSTSGGRGLSSQVRLTYNGRFSISIGSKSPSLICGIARRPTLTKH